MSAGDDVDQGAIAIDQGAAAGARCDGGGELQDAKSSTGAGDLVGGADGGEDAFRSRPSEAVGVGDGENPFTGGKRRRASRNQHRKAAPGDLEGRHVAALIGTEEFDAVEDFSVRHPDLDFGRAFNGVQSRKNDAVFLNDDARCDAMQPAGAFAAENDDGG